jgi:MYXO-CTERM domain-containing protein
MKAGVVLPDGREVGLVRTTNPSGGTPFQWPMFSKEMPWAERIEELTPAGPIVLVDNRELIDRLLREWNDSVGWVSEGLDAGRGGAGGAGGTFATGGAGGVFGSGAGGARVDAGAEPPMVTTGAGCGCSVPGRSSSGGGTLLLLGLVFVLRRRTRR